jgi:hypothetical protein
LAWPEFDPAPRLSRAREVFCLLFLCMLDVVVCGDPMSASWRGYRAIKGKFGLSTETQPGTSDDKLSTQSALLVVVQRTHRFWLRVRSPGNSRDPPLSQRDAANCWSPNIPSFKAKVVEE